MRKIVAVILVAVAILFCVVFESFTKERGEKVKKEEIVTHTVPDSYVGNFQMRDGWIAFINSVAEDPRIISTTLESAPSYIHVYNLTSRTMALIPYNFPLPSVGSFSIFNNTIMWADLIELDGDFTTRLYVCDLISGKTETVMEEKDIGPWIPMNRLSEDQLLVGKTLGDGYDKIYIHNVTTGERDFVDKGYNLSGAKASEGTLIYVKSDGENEEIYFYDCREKKSYPLKTVKELCGCAVYGTNLVYIEKENGLYGIYLYDLKKGKETLLVVDEFEKYEGSVWEDKVVWDEIRGRDRYIMLYNLTTNEKESIYEDKGFTARGKIIFPVFSPSQIWENIVAWREIEPDSGIPRIKYINLSSDER